MPGAEVHLANPRGGAGRGVVGGHLSPYQRVESRRLRAIGHVVAVALRAAVGAPVDTERGGRIEFVARSGQQPALVDRAVDRRLSRSCRPGISQCATAGLATRAQGVGGHQELRWEESQRSVGTRTETRAMDPQGPHASSGASCYLCQT